MHVIEYAITDLRSLRAVIGILKKDKPTLAEIIVSDKAYTQIKSDISGILGEFGYHLPQSLVVFGVRITTERLKEQKRLSDLAEQERVKQTIRIYSRMKELEKLERVRLGTIKKWFSKNDW